MRIFLLQPDTKISNNINFQGKTETFWKIYNSKLEGIPLRDTIIRSIGNRENLLGEGFTKQGFIMEGLKNYVIRVYKNAFKPEDLEKGFSKPEDTFQNFVDRVVLSIPEKIDIVKAKSGKPLGVDEYGLKMCPPMENVQISRDETLRSFELYKQLRYFPQSAFKQAYTQMKRFNSQAGYQFDILNPNNILIDVKNRAINFIDPMEPKINRCEEGKEIDFSKYHGCDTIYPVLCDFLMQKEHLKNLTPQERKEWCACIKIIIRKCIDAGEKNGCRRNLEDMQTLFTRIDNLWSGGERVVSARFDNFVDLYSDVISQSNTAEQALDYNNPVSQRINAIKRLDFHRFYSVKQIFEKIVEAPHQPKVEYPEILNAVLDKVKDYGKDAKDFVPALEALLDKEIFYTTKKRIYNLFLELQPDNIAFLRAAGSSMVNPIERTLYETELKALYERINEFKPRYRKYLMGVIKSAEDVERFPKEMVDKLWISRTCTNLGEEQNIAVKGMTEGYRYIKTLKKRVPRTSDLVELHKIVMANAPRQEKIIGKIRNPEMDYLFSQIFNIEDIKKTVNPYYDTKDVPKGLAQLDKYIRKNYKSMEPHLLASNIFSRVVAVHPFYNGNGRVARLFTEQFLLSKGLRLTKWPEETLYRKTCSVEELAEKLKECTVKD